MNSETPRTTVPTPSLERESLVSEPISRSVGIGASAGGLQAIGDLLRHLPADLRMAFVVVIHLDPTHASSMPELLGKLCELPVHSVVDGLGMQAGHVYVIPPNTSMSVHGQTLLLEQRSN